MGDFFNWHEDALPLDEVAKSAANGGLSISVCLSVCPVHQCLSPSVWHVDGVCARICGQEMFGRVDGSKQRSACLASRPAGGVEKDWRRSSRETLLLQEKLVHKTLCMRARKHVIKVLLRATGQRVATLLVYLNDVPAAGGALR